MEKHSVQHRRIRPCMCAYVCHRWKSTRNETHILRERERESALSAVCIYASILLDTCSWAFKKRGGGGSYIKDFNTKKHPNDMFSNEKANDDDDDNFDGRCAFCIANKGTR